MSVVRNDTMMVVGVGVTSSVSGTVSGVVSGRSRLVSWTAARGHRSHMMRRMCLGVISTTVHGLTDTEALLSFAFEADRVAMVAQEGAVLAHRAGLARSLEARASTAESALIGVGGTAAGSSAELVGVITECLAKLRIDAEEDVVQAAEAFGSDVEPVVVVPVHCVRREDDFQIAL